MMRVCLALLTAVCAVACGSRSGPSNAETNGASAGTGAPRTPAAQPQGPAPSVADAVPLQVPRRFELTHVQPAAFASALGNDPSRLFEFVRDRIAYESYDGCLRGPTGTLLAMAGNSVDRSMLLASLLRAAGQRVRFATGQLPPETARALIQAMWTRPPAPPPPPPSGRQADPRVERTIELLRTNVERDFRTISSLVPPGANARPSIDAASLAPEASAHTWIQWLKDGAWIDLDPSFADAAPRKTYAQVSSTMDEIPESSFHHVSLTVRVEQYVDGQFSQRDVLTYSARAADLSGADLVVSHQPETWRGPAATLSAGLAAALEDTGRIKPVLLAGANAIAGEVFPGLPRTRGIGSVQSMLSGMGTRRDFPLTTGEWIEFKSTRPDGSTQQSTREVFDLVGVATRMTGSKPDEAKVKARAMAPDAFDVTRHVFSLFVTTGRIHASSVSGALAEEADVAQHPDLRRALRKLHVLFAGTSDALAQQLGRASRAHVLLYPDAARLQILEFASEANRGRLVLDLRDTRTRAVSLDAPADQVVRARMFQGIVEGTLERALLEYVASLGSGKVTVVYGTSAIFDRAAQDGVGAALVTRDSPMLKTLPEDTAARLDDDLSGGRAIVAPARPVSVQDRARFGWWRVDPRTGETIAVGDDGLHVTSLEYTIVHNKETGVTYIVCNGSVVDAGLYGTAYYVSMMMRIVDGLWPWMAVTI